MNDYQYETAGHVWENGYLLKPVLALLKQYGEGCRIFELGCGNGATANMLTQMGYEVTGIDISPSGIEIANHEYPGIALSVGDVYDDLAAQHGTYPVVISLEVIEHCMYPRKLLSSLYGLISDGGVGIISTPYHSYLKNLSLAITGKMDEHFTAMWDGGHIKFFSLRTLSALLEEAGFDIIDFIRVGRFPALAKSMIVVIRKKGKENWAETAL